MIFNENILEETWFQSEEFLLKKIKTYFVKSGKPRDPFTFMCWWIKTRDGVLIKATKRTSLIQSDKKLDYSELHFV